MPAGPAGGSMEMGNKGRRDNFVKVNGFIKKRKKLILIVIKFILAIGKNICQRELFIWYHMYQNNSFLGYMVCSF